MYLENCPQLRSKQSKNGKFTSSYKASPLDFEAQISLRRYAASNISPSKRAFEKCKPQGLFSAFYGIPWQHETIVTALRICRNVGSCHWRTITIYQETKTNCSKMNPFLENCDYLPIICWHSLALAEPYYVVQSKWCQCKEALPLLKSPCCKYVILVLLHELTEPQSNNLSPANKTNIHNQNID